MTTTSRLSRYKILLAFTSSVFALLPAAANAVVVPNTARPEAIQKQFNREERPAVGGKQIISIQDQDGKAIKGGVTFELKEVQIEGASQFTPEELKQFYQDKIGKKITLAELNKIAENITSFYRNNGFILTKAIVPPQRINKGVVKIRIIEGFVSDVQIKGDVGGADSVLYKYAEKIKAAKPLDAATLEHYLLLMEDLPGVEARAVLRPSPTTPGASQVIVNIKRDMMQGTSFALNNRGTRYLGPVQSNIIFAANNLMGNDEQTSVRFLNTPFDFNELKYYGAHHEMVVGSQGTKLTIDGNFVLTEPGYTLEPFDIRGTDYAVSAGVSHPIIRSRQTNWFVNSDFSVQRINLSTLGVNLYQDHLRVLKAGSSYDFVDSLEAVNRIEGNVSKGFSWDTSNGGLDHSRANGESSFWKFTANATRIQPIYGAWSASFAVDGQYSADPLYSAEEYALGGQNFGSAFDPAEISGDSALAGRVELQYNGTLNDIYLPSYQAYSFYDIGKVWNRDIQAASEAKEASLASAGIGARLNVTEAVSGNMELAFPLTRKVAAYGADGSAPRFFFHLQYRY